MDWEEAVQRSKSAVAVRRWACSCSPKCSVTVYREANGEATRLHRDIFGATRMEEIEGFADWEPLGEVR